MSAAPRVRGQGSRSRISRMPAAIRGEIERLIVEGKTIDEITAHLRTLDSPASRSAVGRYVRDEGPTLRRLRAARMLTDSWWEQIKADPEGRVGRLVAASLQAAAATSLDAIHEGDAPPDPRDLHYLARALRDVGASEDAAVRRERALRERITAVLDKQESEAPAGDAGAAKREALRRIREDVYGLFEDRIG